MKIVLTLCMVMLMLSGTVNAQTKTWYASFGLSIFAENADSDIGAGVGYPIAFGRDLTKMVGVECQIDFAPTIDEFSYIERLDADLFERISTYDVQASGTIYTSLMGKITRPFTHKINVVFRAGIANYTNDAEVVIQTDQGQESTLDVVNSRGTIAVTSIGFEFAPFQNWDRPIALAVTRYFGEEHESFNVSVGIRFKF